MLTFAAIMRLRGSRGYKFKVDASLTIAAAMFCWLVGFSPPGWALLHQRIPWHLSYIYSVMANCKAG